MISDKGKKIDSKIFITILPLTAMLTVFFSKILYKAEIIEILKVSITTLLTTTAVVFYIRFHSCFNNVKYSSIIIFISYMMSILLVMLTKNPQNFIFWILGGIINAMLIDKTLGLLIYFNMVFLLSMNYIVGPEVIIHFLIMGILFVLLSDALKSKSTVIYASIILLSTNITLTFVINNFIFDASNTDYLLSFFSIFAVLVTAFLLSQLYEKISKIIAIEMAENDYDIPNITEASENTEVNIGQITPEIAENIPDTDKQISSELNENIKDTDKLYAYEEDTRANDEQVSSATAEETDDLYKQFTSENNDNIKDSDNVDITDANIRDTNIIQNITRTSYDVLLSDDNELMQKVKNFSEKLYKHSRLIGDLSARAAKLIGADEDLAKAGGYYHEIGKINGFNYIEEGLKLADEYSFPEKLKNIIRQHNIKYDKPTFKESAIVMISDNVATTIEYIEKTGEAKIAPDKIIDDIFRMRMEKGTFDESGLTVKEFKLLKEFFRNEFKSTGNNYKEEN